MEEFLNDPLLDYEDDFAAEEDGIPPDDPDTDSEFGIFGSDEEDDGIPDMEMEEDEDEY